jgi:TatD DNase family protein
MAVQMDMPVAVHTRAAWDDMCSLLEQESARASEQGGRLRGVLHAFSEDATTYERLRRVGDFVFGIGGVVTFKKSIVAEAVAAMSLDDIVLETDCPYLTPVPYRGRRNESSYVRYVCERVADIKGVSAEEVARRTSDNARRMFAIE